MVLVVLVTASAVLSVVAHYGAPVPAQLVLAVRCIAILAFIPYGLRKRSLTTWIFIAMIAGAALGHDFPQIALNVRVLGLIFLRLIRTIVAPLLFATLVSGIAGHSDLKKVGRMGVKAIVYFEIVTTVALVIGLVAINVSKAGVGAKVPTTATAEALQVQKLTASETILHIFPENLAKSVAEGQILQVVVFSILFGIALAQVREDRRRPVLNFTESLAETMFKFTNLVMYFAPMGVGAAIAYTVASTGMGILLNLARLLATFHVVSIAPPVLLRSLGARPGRFGLVPPVPAEPPQQVPDLFPIDRFHDVRIRPQSIGLPNHPRIFQFADHDNEQIFHAPR